MDLDGLQIPERLCSVPVDICICQTNTIVIMYLRVFNVVESDSGV